MSFVYYSSSFHFNKQLIRNQGQFVISSSVDQFVVSFLPFLYIIFKGTNKKKDNLPWQRPFSLTKGIFFIG